MYLTLTFYPGLRADERTAVRAVLAKLVDDDVISHFDPSDPDDSWLLEVGGVYASSRAGDRAVEHQVAQQAAKALKVAVRGAHFAIKMIIEHGCTGCGHCCESEEVLWTTESPARPEETELMSALLNGDV